MVSLKKEQARYLLLSLITQLCVLAGRFRPDNILFATEKRRIQDMPNGKPEDHPLTDIFIHNRYVEYGEEASLLIKRIGELSSKRELDEWWEKEIGWNGTPKIALRKAKARVQELEKRARESGWELKSNKG